jgi:hypothetical protein
VTGTADVVVTGNIVGDLTNVDVSQNVPVTYEATVSNDITSDGDVSGTLSISASVTPSGECTVTPSSDSMAVVDLAPGAIDTLTVNAILHCTKPSDHTLNVVADFAETEELHLTINVDEQAVSDSDAFESWAYADLKITSLTLNTPDALPLVAGKQILVQPGVAKSLSFSEVDHNNGPYGPATFTVSSTVADSGPCDFTPNAAGGGGTANVSVAVNKPLSASVTWTDLENHGPAEDKCDLSMSKTISGTAGHIVDPDLSNNDASVDWQMVLDTDGDTVPDDFDGDTDNCRYDANPDQADSDIDGLGDACDTTHNVSLDCPVMLGPAAVNLSDNNGRYGWIVCTINNAGEGDSKVTVSSTITNPPAGCTQDYDMVLPGQPTFIVLDGEVKSLVQRIRLECHLPAVKGTYEIEIEKCIDPDPLASDDDGDTVVDEDPIDHEDNDGDTQVDEDPPDTDGPDDCVNLEKPVVIDP